MWAQVISFFTSSLFKYIGIGVLICGALYIYYDYQEAKKNAEKYEQLYTRSVAQIKAQVDLTKQIEDTYIESERKLKEDLKQSAIEAQKSKKRAITLQKKVSELNNIKRKKENENCPLHPAIVSVFDWMHEDIAARSSNSTATLPINLVAP
jgi:Skp family chaperone for outer membrane proteins